MVNDPTAFDPAAWINLGAVGLFLLAFVTGRIYSSVSVRETQLTHDKNISDLRATMERLMAAGEVREAQLRTERDRALAERDEMIEVMKDFTHTAAAILQKRQSRRETG